MTKKIPFELMCCSVINTKLYNLGLKFSQLNTIIRECFQELQDGWPQMSVAVYRGITVPHNPNNYDVLI